VQVEPDILIIDEALAVGDALFQKRCLQRIAKLVDDGTTLLFVSHDQENVRTLTSRALLLDKGRPAAWGPTPEVLLEYRRRLNEEEESYFSAAVRNLATRARAEEALAQAVRQHTEPSQDIAARSFGNENIAIMAVETLDGDGKPCAVYFPGDTLLIRVTCRANVEAERLNVSVRIRNKEGVKIYSWGTLNQDMAARSRDTGAPTFWSRKVKVGETFAVLMQCACNLGVNLYEVQAGVSIEETPDYMSQRIVHWIDEAAFFQVLMKKEEHFFGGAVDLRMKAIW
jgi:lipopolysaccharide transport system ATP-binding protein